MAAYKINHNKELGRALLKIAYGKDYRRLFMKPPNSFEIWDEYDYWITLSEINKSISFANDKYTPSDECNLLDFITKLRSRQNG